MRLASRVAGLFLLTAAVAYLLRAADGGGIAEALRGVAADPIGVVAVLACYAGAFLLRTRAWTAALPALPAGQAWAALHVSLLGNHVLPFRLGEPLRVTSVLRRTDLPAGPVVATAVLLRTADVLAVLMLAMLAAPYVMRGLAGPWLPAVAAGLLLLGLAGFAWVRRLARASSGGPATRPGDRPVRSPGPLVGAAVLAAWVLESAVIWEVARAAGVALSVTDAVAVTAVTIAAQAVAVTPGGIGSYEAAATAALVAMGVPAAPALGVAVAAHVVKTGYALGAGAVALIVPDPTYWGRLRLPAILPGRPTPWPAPAVAPVVAVIPVHNEERTVGDVVRRLPGSVDGRPVRCVVVDDGSTDASASGAAAAGATVIRHPGNLGLGAAVRRGLAEATALGPAAVVYLDADGEYRPEELPRLAGPVLSGAADYVVGSRFAGRIEHMLPHRRIGNRVLTWWVRWLTRNRDITDGQSGYRAFSPRAAAEAEIVHDYNYAQVLTADLIGKGFRYAEVPISYAFRSSGTSFVRLGRYLRNVVPAVYRELNGAS